MGGGRAMSDGVLAAIIAAGATVFTSFLQLRTSFSKQFAAGAQSTAGRRKSRLPFFFILAMLVGAAVGGFALAQWLHEYERLAQNALQRDLRERIADMSLTRGELERTRAATHDDIEAEVLRRMGADGVAVLATVAPCLAARVANPTALAPAGENASPSSSPPSQTAPVSSLCSESDAAPITLCATIPAAAKLTDVDLYVRGSDAAGSWIAVTAGQETEQVRFSEKAVESPDGAAKQVCEGFVQWSERARIARMVVHFSF
jgi:hypothetical protein